MILILILACRSLICALLVNSFRVLNPIIFTLTVFTSAYTILISMKVPITMTCVMTLFTFFCHNYLPNLLYCSTIQLDIFLKNLLIFIMFFILYIIKELIHIGSSPLTTIFYTPYLMINFPIRYFIPYRERRDMPQYSIIWLSCIITVV